MASKTAYFSHNPKKSLAYCLAICFSLGLGGAALADTKIADNAANMGATTAARTPDGVLEVVGGNTNKPIFVARPAANDTDSGQVSAASANTSLIIRNSGNVGIGTAGPVRLLHVNSTAATPTTPSDSPTILATSANGNPSAIMLQSATSSLVLGNTGATAFGSLPADSGFLGRPGANLGSVHIGSGWGTATPNITASFDNLNGRVGIGTTAPSTKLHISGSTGWQSSGFMTENTGANPRKYSLAARTDLTGAFSIADETVGLNRFVINTSGNVGIGTTTPTNQLTVGPATGSGSNNRMVVKGISADDAFAIENFNSTKRWALTVFNGDFRIGEQGVAYPLSILQTSGNVGIGTTAPRAKLEVNGTGNVSIGNYAYLNGSGTGGPCCAGASAYSVWGSGRIAAVEFNAFSDERIKNIKGKSNSTEDLDILRKLEVTDYILKDVVEQSNKPQKKVIAQQVEKFYPQAVNISSEFIPNVYQPAFKVVNNGNGNYELAWEKGVPQESKRTDKIKLITDKGQVMATIIALDDKSAKIKTDEYIGEKVFVYGVEVSDFHSLDYEALSTLNISATQALSAQLEAQKAENKELRAEIEAIKAALKR